MEIKKYFITTPIFYPSGKFHIGTLHTMINGDFIYRATKLFGYDSYFITGLDEHGDKVKHNALKSYPDYPESLAINEYLDKQAQIFSNLCEQVNIDYSNLVRTTDNYHELKVQEIWTQLYNEGYIYKSVYSGYYSEKDETFFQKYELINDLAPTGHKVEFVEHEAYFFKSSILEDQLREVLNNNILEEGITSYVYTFLKDGLRDFCISRPRGSWGIGVPNDDKHVIYVWFDALLNYLNYLPKGFSIKNAVHIMAKDIIIFHVVHWFCLLIALKKPLPYKIIMHNWWLIGDEKMSKSTKSITPENILESNHGKNSLRLYLLINNLMNHDGNFSDERRIDLFNTFVNKFANLVYRVFSFVKNKQLFVGEKIENNFYGKNLKNNLFNSEEYIKLLFNWCDELNKQIDEKQIWNNPEEAIIIGKEIKSLIYYFQPVIPDVSFLVSNPYEKLFTKI